MSGKPASILSSAVVFICLMFLPLSVSASDIPHYHDIPAYQYKNVFEADRVSFSNIRLYDGDALYYSEPQPLKENIRFKIFNTTTQETEGYVTAADGVLPELKLIRDHGYMIQAVDSKYRMNSRFVWVHDDRLLNVKDREAVESETYDYPDLTGLTLYRRSTEIPDPESYERYHMSAEVLYGSGPMSNVKFSLVSDVETIEAVCQNGKLQADLLDEVTYTVTVCDDRYDIDPFPMAVKDKSEYGMARYVYDHSNCKCVDARHQDHRPILLTDKGSGTTNTTVTSPDKRVTLSGFNFKDLIVDDVDNDPAAAAVVQNKTADIYRFRLINPHRGEVSKLAAGSFTVALTLSRDLEPEKVYRLAADGSISSIGFTRNGNRVSLRTDRITTDTYIVTYKPKPEAAPKPDRVRPKGTSITKLKAGRRAVNVRWKKQSGLTGGKHIAGYQIRYAGNRKFSSAHTKTVRGYTKKALTVRKLKTKKAYYFKVRTFRQVKSGGRVVKLYSGWSKIRRIKTG